MPVNNFPASTLPLAAGDDASPTAALQVLPAAPPAPPDAAGATIYSRELHDAMLDLEEDPGQYRLLLSELLKAHHPLDAAQTLLVEDIAWLRWQKRRNQRAQAGLIVRARERALNKRSKRRMELNREIADAAASSVAEHGLMALPDSPAKFAKARIVLDTLADQVRRREFALDPEPALTLLYGKQRDTLRAVRVTNSFRRLRDGASPAAPAAPPPETSPEELAEGSLDYEKVILLFELLDEKQHVNDAYEWYLKEHVEITPALLNGCFAPSKAEWRAVRLQEQGYDREIERKTLLLLKLQKSTRAPGDRDRDRETGRFAKKQPSDGASKKRIEDE